MGASCGLISHGTGIATKDIRKKNSSVEIKARDEADKLFVKSLGKGESA